MEIKFKDVCFSYNHNTSIEENVLSNINLLFDSGKIYGLIGSNGSGKSTLVQLINGLLIPTSGKITIGKYKIDSKTKQKSLKDLRSNIGMVFQCPQEQLFCHTVKEEIYHNMNLLNVKSNILEEQAIDVLKMVGLDDTYLSRDPLSLSYGEMKMVAFASVLACDPKIIILDDLTTGLDDLNKNLLIKIIRKLKIKYGKTIIISTTDTNFLLKLVDWVYLLENGNIEFSDEKYETLSNEVVLNKSKLLVPDILSFSNLVLKKKQIKIGYRDDINDLIKDVYRYVK